MCRQHRIGEEQHAPSRPHPVVESDVFLGRQRARLREDEDVAPRQRQRTAGIGQAVERLQRTGLQQIARPVPAILAFQKAANIAAFAPEYRQASVETDAGQRLVPVFPRRTAPAPRERQRTRQKSGKREALNRR
ncbi:hypothetical protein GCM10011494_07070 [Novosphingobium endophyticum]|uniref:Uncharacterized protein n=1 Tax=Novosphingobium endophyticum TaxID=1955250 RepID=A0A916TQI8_9SPHN|nr:hypothetical protein GCM10011494_07070 [Novosphingobium endophyticum]